MEHCLGPGCSFTWRAVGRAFATFPPASVEKVALIYYTKVSFGGVA